MQEKKNNLVLNNNRKRLIRVHSKTNENYGKKPSERNIKELIDNGFINLDKPNGPTSHQVDSWVKKILDISKVGHSGTLDPNATGVLPIATGAATKAISVLLIPGKEYVGVIRLHKDAAEKKIIQTCESMVGTISQIPPVRSAVKRVKRKRAIYYFDVLEIKQRHILFKVGCESGTYVRTLAVDIGKKLKVGAHLEELRRTKVGNITEEESVFLQDLKDAIIFYKEDGDEKHLRKILMPMEKILEHIPKLVIRDSAVDAICHGADLAVPGVVELDSDIKKDDIIAIMTLKGEGVAIAKAIMPSEQIIQKDNGICANIQRVLMNKGTYPPIWKK